MELFGVYGHELDEVFFFGAYSSDAAAQARIEELKCHEEDGEMPYGEVMDFRVLPFHVDVPRDVIL